MHMRREGGLQNQEKDTRKSLSLPPSSPPSSFPPLSLLFRKENLHTQSAHLKVHIHSLYAILPHEMHFPLYRSS